MFRRRRVKRHPLGSGTVENRPSCWTGLFGFNRLSREIPQIPRDARSHTPSVWDRSQRHRSTTFYFISNVFILLYPILSVQGQDSTFRPTSGSNDWRWNADLKRNADPGLWVLDTVGRLHHTSDRDERLTRAIELGVWLDDQLKLQTWEMLTQDHPILRSLFTEDNAIHSQPEAMQDAVAVVHLARTRHRVTALSALAFERAMHPPDASNETREELARLARDLRAITDRLTQLTQDNTLQSWQAVRAEQLRGMASTTLGWTLCYTWLLPPSNDSEIRDLTSIQAAKQIFLSELRASEIDIRGSELFRWFDPERRDAANHLLGLALCYAAENRWPEANSCFATLQQHADNLEMQRLILWQTLSLLVQERWDDATLVARTYLLNLPSKEQSLAMQTWQTMLKWLPATDSPSTGNQETDRQETADGVLSRAASIWKWRLLEVAIQRGQIDEVSRWLQRDPTPLPNAGLAVQVLKAHRVLKAKPLASRPTNERETLIAGLQKWVTTTPDQDGAVPIPRPIKHWAWQWLWDLHMSLEQTALAQNIALEWFEDLPAEPSLQRQAVAWRIAQACLANPQADASQEAEALRWYRTAQMELESPLSAISSVQARLLELKGRPQAQRSYLRSIPPAAAEADYAYGQLITRLYSDFSSLPGADPRREPIARELRQLLERRLGIPASLVTFPSDTATVDRQRMWTERFQNWQASTNLPQLIPMLSVWLEVIASEAKGNVDSPQTINHTDFFKALISWVIQLPRDQRTDWLPLQVSTLLLWDPSESLGSDDAWQAELLNACLTPAVAPTQQQALLGKVAPRWLKRWEARRDAAILAEPSLDPLQNQAPAWADPQPAITAQLLGWMTRWWELSRPRLADQPNDSLATKVACDYAELLVTSGQWDELDRLLDSFPDISHSWELQRLRALQLSHRRALEAETAWQQLATTRPVGGPQWWEAKFRSLQSLARRDSAEGQTQYRRLVQLYPEIPSPWNARLATLAKTMGWL